MLLLLILNYLNVSLSDMKINVCSYLCDMDVFVDDLCSVLRGEFTKNHQLNPLRDAIKQSDGAL